MFQMGKTERYWMLSRYRTEKGVRERVLDIAGQVLALTHTAIYQLRGYG